MIPLRLFGAGAIRRRGFGVPGWSVCLGKCFWETVHPPSAVVSSGARSGCLYSPCMGASPRRLIKPKERGDGFLRSWLEARGQEGAGMLVGMVLRRTLPGQQQRGKSIPALLPPPDAKEQGSTTFLSRGEKGKRKKQT